MAFYDPNKDEDQDPNQSANGVQTGPGSSVITPGDGGAPSAQGAPQAAGSPDKGGNFVGLQTYLNANKPQAEKLGNQVAGVVTNSANQARDSVSGLNQKFNQAVDQNTVQNSQNLGDAPESLSDDQRAQLKRQYNAQYRGPSQLSDLSDDYMNSIKATNTATQNMTDAMTEAGRGNLINQVNSAPRNRGVTTFDNILLQKGPGQEKVNQAVNQSQDVKDLLSNAQTSAQQKVGMFDDPSTPDINEATGAKGTTEKTQKDTYKTVQDALNAWKSGFDQRLANAQDTGLQSRITQDLGEIGAGDPYLTQETMETLGLTPNTRIYRTNLQDYLNPFSPTDVNAANFATPEDYARYGALADIAGVQDPFLNQANASKAGTAPQFGINQLNLKQGLLDAQNNYENKYATQTGITKDFGMPQVLPGIDANKQSYDNFTPKEIVEQVIPRLTGMIANTTDRSAQDYFQGLINQLKSAVNQFKSSEGYNNMVKSEAQRGMDPNVGPIRAWI